MQALASLADNRVRLREERCFPLRSVLRVAMERPCYVGPASRPCPIPSQPLILHTREMHKMLSSRLWLPKAHTLARPQASPQSCSRTDTLVLKLTSNHPTISLEPPMNKVEDRVLQQALEQTLSPHLLEVMRAIVARMLRLLQLDPGLGSLLGAFDSRSRHTVA